MFPRVSVALCFPHLSENMLRRAGKKQQLQWWRQESESGKWGALGSVGCRRGPGLNLACVSDAPRAAGWGHGKLAWASLLAFEPRGLGWDKVWVKKMKGQAALQPGV